MAGSVPIVVIVEDDADYAATLEELVASTVTPRVKSVASLEDLWRVDLSEAKCVIFDFYLGEREPASTVNVIPALEKMRSEHRDIKVILHSGLAEPVDIIRSDEYGIYSYIPKGGPTAASELIKTLKAIIAEPTATSLGEPAAREGVIGELGDEGADLRREAEEASRRFRERLSEQHHRVKGDYQSIVEQVSDSLANGQPISSLFDIILDIMRERTGACGGAWFLLDKDRRRFRDKNCRSLGRQVSVPKDPQRAFGLELWRLLESEPILESTVVRLLEIKGEAELGLFRPPGLLICGFSLKPYDYLLIFALELASTKMASAASAVDTYVSALGSMLSILTTSSSRAEFGRIGRLVGGAERGVPLWQVVSRGFLLVLAIGLFLAAAISTLFSLIVLITATLGFPDFLSKPLKWAPEHYAVGIVYALEILILTITLYLLGIGISCMIDHPRLSHVPPVLRYLDKPNEMKKSLLMAVCTLLGVAGLKEVLEMPDFEAMDAVRVWAFSIKMVALVLLILVLTLFLEKLSHNSTHTDEE